MSLLILSHYAIYWKANVNWSSLTGACIHSGSYKNVKATEDTAFDLKYFPTNNYGLFSSDSYIIKFDY